MPDVKGLYKTTLHSCIRQLVMYHHGAIMVYPDLNRYREVKHALDSLAVSHGWSVSPANDHDNREAFLLENTDMELLLKGVDNTRVQRDDKEYLLLSHYDAVEAAKLFGVILPPLAWPQPTIVLPSNHPASSPSTSSDKSKKREISPQEKGEREAQESANQHVAAVLSAQELKSELKERDKDPKSRALDRLIAARNAPSPRGRLP